MIERAFVGGLCCLLAWHVCAQPPTVKKTSDSAKEIKAILETKVETSDFQKPMTLKDGLSILHEKLAKPKKALAVRIARDALAEENPKAPDPLDAVLRLKLKAKEMPAGELLSEMLAQVTTNNLVYVVRDGYIEITTAKAAKERP